MNTDLGDFLTNSGALEAIEVVSFKSIPPQYVGLTGPDGRTVYVASDMIDFGNRTEVGSLRLVDDRKPSDSDSKETLAGGRILRLDYLAAPGFNHVSGVKIVLDRGELIITAGDAPYSLFVGFGDIRIGRPEFPLDQYRPIEPA